MILQVDTCTFKHDELMHVATSFLSFYSVCALGTNMLIIKIWCTGSSIRWLKLTLTSTCEIDCSLVGCLPDRYCDVFETKYIRALHFVNEINKFDKVVRYK